MVMLPHDTPLDTAISPPATSPSREASSANLHLLDRAHSKALERALGSLLSTEVAEFTYAQIVDGLPTEDSLQEFQNFRPGHTVVELGHRSLCAGWLEKARKFISDFVVSSLRFAVPLLLAFQDTTPGSKHFHLRLIELLAISCHQIAVYLFQLDEGAHKHNDYEAWLSSLLESPCPLSRALVAFCHNDYVFYDQYLNGVTDCVGYWAEAKVFGGVVVFDRGESEKECNDVFLHGSLLGGRNTIYAPTASQFNDLITFLGDVDEQAAMSKCPLPVNDGFLNRFRWDPWEAMARFHVFRDRHERRISPTRHPRFRYMKNARHWPEAMDMVYLGRQVGDEAAGRPVDWGRWLRGRGG